MHLRFGVSRTRSLLRRRDQQVYKKSTRKVDRNVLDLTSSFLDPKEAQQPNFHRLFPCTWEVPAASGERLLRQRYPKTRGAMVAFVVSHPFLIFTRSTQLSQQNFRWNRIED